MPAPASPKIAVIGGGPGGLYFALLTKQKMPHCSVAVYEQNQPGDTFGFGVVFSDETLDEFLSADPQSYALIRDSFAYWSDIVIEHEGERTVVGGNGFAGCSRFKLLEILQTRCSQVGVDLCYGDQIEPSAAADRFSNHDLVVVADGVNSKFRQHYRAELGAIVEDKRNKFAWMGSTRPLDAFTFFFKKTSQGHFCAHAYQYEEGRSTWVIETTPECWAACGFETMNEEQSARFLEDVFAAELQGHRLFVNRSLWRNFPKITCERWSVGNIALLGDAKATAHWSIGSGTKLAMECAMALSECVAQYPDDIRTALTAYEKSRRTPVEITQHNAEVSLRWFENMPAHWEKHRYEFAFSLMSRAKALTWDNIGMRDPRFLRQVEEEFYARSAVARSLAAGRPTPMFTPFDLRGLTIRNRVVMAPMAQYSAIDGVLTDWHFVHYGARALGGAGLIITEMTCPAPGARITRACAGLWNDEQESRWRRLVEFVHSSNDSKIALQLGHAGRKGSTKTPAEGMDAPLEEGGWDLCSASPIPYIEGFSATPAELDRSRMDVIREEFVAAARRGARAGFDMLELHCAHGYLLASFLSPLTNQRTDEYGGDAGARALFPVEVLAAIRQAWPADRPISVRISACDWAAGGVTSDDVAATANAFRAAGADIIHVSTGETVKHQKPVYGRMWQTPFAEHVKHAARIPVIAVGDISLPEQINAIIAASRADLCALARPHLNNPFFTRQAAAHYGVSQENFSWPVQLKSGEYQLYREAEKANEKLHELALKARPNRRHYKKAGD